MTIEMVLTRIPPASSECATRSGAGSDFARLSARIADAGLLRRRPGYYAARIAIVTAMFIGGWAAVIGAAGTWWVVALAPVMAIVFAQIALLAHDIAHRQVFRTRRASEVAGWIAGNLGIGMSYGWWMDKHTRHHANPNHEERDPDVAPDLLVWSQRQARSARGLARLIGRCQATLFVPLLTLEAVNLRMSSVRALLRSDSPAGLRRRGLEAALMTVHVIWYAALLFTVLPAPHAVAFLLVHQVLFGLYLGGTFAPNHKGMPTLTGADNLDFLRKQVLTSRDVRGGRLLDAAMGGLNYQIEHHLFPSMPTANLPRARPIVRAYCAELGLPHHESRLLASYRLALAHLHRVGAPLRSTS